MAASQNYIGVNVTGNLSARDISVVFQPQPPDPPLKNLRFKVEKPITTFTGREKFLDDLYKVVKEGQVLGEGRITVLTQAPFFVVAATGGIGKTETVRMYIQLHTHEYDHVIWIDAEEKSLAKNQFIELATRLNISTDFDDKPKEFDTILTQIFEKLLQNAHVVLLVFDNAEAFDDDEDLSLSGIRSLRPKNLSPFFVEPTIIVTSRNQNWNLHKVIQLDLWTEVEVVVFVIERLGLQETAENKELATQLGNLFSRLPIALQAAVAVIFQQTKRKKKYGIQNLIDEYERGSRKVLAQKPLDANMRLTHMSFTMLVLWNISFEKIVKFPDGGLAIKILCFMAYLSPTRIPQDLINKLFEKDFSQDRLENALEILEDHSLIASVNSADSESHCFSIHRMIQDATVENLKTNEVQKSSTIFNKNTFLNETDVLMRLSVESIQYIVTLDTRGIPRGGEIVENLVHITNHVSKNLGVKEFRDLAAEVARVLMSTNNFTKSIQLYETVLTATPESDLERQIWERINHKRILANLYLDIGFDQKSIELHKEVLKDQTRALGPYDMDTLGTKCNIATVLYRQGNYDAAAAKFREVLQDFRNNQDSGSKCFLTTKNNYAVLLKDQGKTEEAFQLCTELLKECEKNPELNSKHRLRVNGSIADMLREQGKLKGAAAMTLKNISDAIRVFGPFHRVTFKCKRDYAILLRDQGKKEEAAQQFLELLEILETELGSEHPYTLDTKNKLALLYCNTQELDKALPLLDVQIYERVFGPEHPTTMTTANSLAGVMMIQGMQGIQGKLNDALSLYNKNVKHFTQVFGPNHQNTLSTMFNVGATQYFMK